MDNNMALIERIIASTNKQAEAITQKLQNLIDTADLSNPAISSQIQLFTHQLTMWSNAGSALIKVYKDTCQSILQRIG